MLQPGYPLIITRDDLRRNFDVSVVMPLHCLNKLPTIWPKERLANFMKQWR